jgi:hypothetical protein
MYFGKRVAAAEAELELQVRFPRAKFIPCLQFWPSDKSIAVLAR